MLREELVSAVICDEWRLPARLGNSSCLEQRGIRFLLAESVKSCEILSRMQRQYGPSCMSRANFYKWVQAFKDGRESITDDLRWKTCGCLYPRSSTGS